MTQRKQSIDIPCDPNPVILSGKSSTATKLYAINLSSVKEVSLFSQPVYFKKPDSFRQVIQTCRALLQKQGVHSTVSMTAAGFNYTGNGDTVRCDTCELE